MPQYTVLGPAPSPSPATPTATPTATPGSAPTPSPNPTPSPGVQGGNNQPQYTVLGPATPPPETPARTFTVKPVPTTRQIEASHAKLQKRITQKPAPGSPPHPLTAIDGFMSAFGSWWHQNITQRFITNPYNAAYQTANKLSVPGVFSGPGAVGIPPPSAVMRAGRTVADIFNLPFEGINAQMRDIGGPGVSPRRGGVAGMGPYGSALARILTSPNYTLTQKLDTAAEIFGFNASMPEGVTRAQGLPDAELQYYQKMPGFWQAVQHIDQLARNPRTRGQFGLNGNFKTEAGALFSAVWGARADWARWKEKLPAITGAETFVAFLLEPSPKISGLLRRGVNAASATARVVSRGVERARPAVDASSRVVRAVAHRMGPQYEYLLNKMNEHYGRMSQTYAKTRDATTNAIHWARGQAPIIGDPAYPMQVMMGKPGGQLVGKWQSEVRNYAGNLNEKVRYPEFFGDMNQAQMMEIIQAYEHLGIPDPLRPWGKDAPEWHIPINGVSVAERTENLRPLMQESDALYNPAEFPVTYRFLRDDKTVKYPDGTTRQISTTFPRPGFLKTNDPRNFYGRGQNKPLGSKRTYDAFEDWADTMMKQGRDPADLVDNGFLPAVAFVQRLTSKFQYAHFVKEFRKGTERYGLDGKPMVIPIHFTWPGKASEYGREYQDLMSTDETMKVGDRRTFSGKDVSPYDAYQRMQKFARSIGALIAGAGGEKLSKHMGMVQYEATSEFEKAHPGYYMFAGQDLGAPDIIGYAVRPTYIESLIDANPMFRWRQGEVQTVFRMTREERIAMRNEIARRNKLDPRLNMFDLAEEDPEALVQRNAQHALDDELFGPGQQYGALESWNEKMLNGYSTLVRAGRQVKLIGSPGWHSNVNTLGAAIRMSIRLAKHNPAKLAYYWSLIGYSMMIANKEAVKEALNGWARGSRLNIEDPFSRGFLSPRVPFGIAGKMSKFMEAKGINRVIAQNPVSQLISDWDIPGNWMDNAQRDGAFPQDYGLGMKASNFQTLFTLPFKDLSGPQMLKRAFHALSNFGQHITFGVIDARTISTLHHILTDIEKVPGPEAAKTIQDELADTFSLTRLERNLRLQEWFFFYNFWKKSLRMAMWYWANDPRFNVATQAAIANWNDVAGNPGAPDSELTLWRQPDGQYRMISVASAPVRYAERTIDLLSGGTESARSLGSLTTSNLTPLPELAARGLRTYFMYHDKTGAQPNNASGITSPLWDPQAGLFSGTGIRQLGMSILGNFQPMSPVNSFTMSSPGSLTSRYWGIAQGLRGDLKKMTPQDRNIALRYIYELEDGDGTHEWMAKRMEERYEFGSHRSNPYMSLLRGLYK